MVNKFCQLVSIVVLLTFYYPDCASFCHEFEFLFKKNHTCWNTSTIYEIREIVKVDMTNLVEVQFRKSETKSGPLDDVSTLVLPEVCRRSIPESGFSGLTSLRKIIATGINLRNMNSSWFDADNGVEYLDVSRNRLRTLYKEVAQNLLRLKFANFSHNRLNSIEKNTFAELLSLESLDFSFNDLQDINLGNIPRVHTLNLSNNEISLVRSQDFEGMPLLEVLDLSMNLIAYIEDFGFAGMDSLRVLDLSSNSLEQLRREMFEGIQNTRLNYLNLSDNQISDIVKNPFQNFILLKKLDLSKNYITSLNNETFSGLKLLRFLDLSRNNIGFINNHCFETLESLQILLLNANQIENLGNKIFYKNEYLEVLNIANNRIRRLQDNIFENTTKLKKLSASRNKLFNISPNVMNSLQNLHDFEIDYNTLFFLPDMNHTFPNLRRAAIEGNSWQCRCLDEIIKLLDSRNVIYRKTDYFDGQRPVCFVTQTNTCIKDFEGIDRRLLQHIDLAPYCSVGQQLFFYRSQENNRTIYVSAGW